MNLDYTDEQRLMRESVSRTLGAHSLPHRAGTASSRETWQTLADGGWLDLAARGADGTDLSVLMIAAGRAGSTVPLIDRAVLPGRLLAVAGLRHDLDALAGGGLRVAALDEGAPASSVHAVRAGSAWRLSGHAVAAAGGDADRYLMVTEEGGSAQLTIVSGSAPGVSVDPFVAMDGGYGAIVSFADVEIEQDYMFPLESGGRQSAVATATSCICSEAVGLMQFLSEATRTYAMQRVQFGRSIASFQVIEHRLARMHIAVEEAHALASLAAISLAAPPVERDRTLSAAKARIGTLSRYVAQNAVQTHGGMGVSEDMPIAHYFRRLMVFEARFGATRSHLARIASFVASAPDLGRSLIDVSPMAA